MGLCSPAEKWLYSRPLCAAEVARDEAVAELVHQARDAGRDVSLTGENLSWVWGLYAELEAVDPIVHLRAEALEAHMALFSEPVKTRR